jgi:sugar lactone lactonase YvrE
MATPHVSALRPIHAIEGGRLTVEGAGFVVDDTLPPTVHVGSVRARLVCASSSAITVLVPAGLDGGPTPVRVDSVPGEAPLANIGARCATGLHQVDNPVFDTEGNLYVTYSGTRGQQVPVSIFRVHPNGTRETFSSGIVNPTSMAIGPDKRLYVSSRFEGIVYRVADDGSAQPFATDLGVACGLAFAADGTLFVGDRSGTIFRVEPGGRASTFASLPASVAAFHLAFAPDQALFVTGPTLSSYDTVYRIGSDGTVTSRYVGFGRPQGIGFDSTGSLFVIEALAGSSGLYRLDEGRSPELVVSGPNLVGFAFDPRGSLVVCSSDTAYRIAMSR